MPNPQAHLEIRFYDTNKTILSGTFIRNVNIYPNTWQQVTAQVVSPVSTAFAVPMLGLHLPALANWNTSDLFWFDDASLLINGTEALGDPQKGFESPASTFPSWGSSANITLTAQQTTHVHSGTYALGAHATAANSTDPIMYPTTTGYALEYKTASAEVPNVISYWIYWNGTSYKKVRGRLGSGF